MFYKLILDLLRMGLLLTSTIGASEIYKSIKILKDRKKEAFLSQSPYINKTAILHSKKCILSFFQTTPHIMPMVTHKDVRFKYLHAFPEINCVSYIECETTSGFHVTINNGIPKIENMDPQELIGKVLFKHNFISNIKLNVKLSAQENLMVSPLGAGSPDGFLLSIQPAFEYKNQMNLMSIVGSELPGGIYKNLESLIRNYKENEFSNSKAVVSEYLNSIYIVYVHDHFLKKIVDSYNKVRKFIGYIKKIKKLKSWVDTLDKFSQETEIQEVISQDSGSKKK